MSDYQIKILQENNYEVLPSINYIRYLKNDYPIIYIEYNKDNSTFSLNILKSKLVNENDISNAEIEINKAFKLIRLLNKN